LLGRKEIRPEKPGREGSITPEFLGMGNTALCTTTGVAETKDLRQAAGSSKTGKHGGML
jgi:hypothetical protein